MLLVVFISNSLSQSACNPDYKECSCADAYFAVILHIHFYAFDNESHQHFKMVLVSNSGTPPPLVVLDLSSTNSFPIPEGCDHIKEVLKSDL